MNHTTIFHVAAILVPMERCPVTWRTAGTMASWIRIRLGRRCQHITIWGIFIYTVWHPCWVVK